VLEAQGGALNKTPREFVLEAEALLIVSAPNHAELKNARNARNVRFAEAGMIEIGVLIADMIMTEMTMSISALLLMTMELLPSRGGEGGAGIKPFGTASTDGLRS